MAGVMLAPSQLKHAISLLVRHLPHPPAGMSAWEAQAVQQLALALTAFAEPHTTPQEDVELLLGEAASGGPSLLQVCAWGRPSFCPVWSGLQCPQSFLHGPPA